MNTYKRHRFPPDIISHAVWLYYHFNLSHRDIEDLLAERGITVAREAIRLWHPKHSLRSWGRLCIKFKSVRQAQRFVSARAAVQNLFNLSRQLVGAQHYRDLRISVFGEWRRAVA